MARIAALRAWERGALLRVWVMAVTHNTFTRCVGGRVGLQRSGVQRY